MNAGKGCMGPADETVTCPVDGWWTPLDPGQAALEVVALDIKPDTEHAQHQLHLKVDRIVSVKPVNLRNADTTVHVSIYYMSYMQLPNISS